MDYNHVFLFILLGTPWGTLTQNTPIVVTTWNFINATNRAWDILNEGGKALDAIEQGATVCEEQQCDGTVGYGGSPDEESETTLDAMIMDGKTMNVGAVAALRRIKNAISVARNVLEHTQHSILAGELATQFAVQMGFREQSLTTKVSKNMWKQWHNQNNCQPNYWIDVIPDPRSYCGPYSKSTSKSGKRMSHHTIPIGKYNHDTIGMIAIDVNGNVAAGTSTNGAKYKIPGRVGDSPVPGSGAYADNSVGGAAATGDGDVMLRFLPSFLAVEEMRRGARPSEAAETAVQRISEHYPGFMGAVVAVSRDGQHGAACHGIDTFPYAIHDSTTDTAKVIFVKC
ncbi:N(4)-(Beta-N-acetylglucosaminyl)-L-asparaginase [Eumeta japonica]|uniref:N(4)-(beta-N-acetylglucosaminyl)-L-asparaginase n=1 Tax=Eumeta variegata TaxID=151549 RepID=A0A4C1SPY4_EUMVA|nr:N(4)-(Beta-N-acetylglucosaminyl)-L-asparaginase [Eumeta japonica]